MLGENSSLKERWALELSAQGGGGVTISGTVQVIMVVFVDGETIWS